VGCVKTAHLISKSLNDNGGKHNNMDIINRGSITNNGQWTSGAQKGSHNYKGVEYLRASLPESIFHLGITLSGDKDFWYGELRASGASKAEAWFHHFIKDNGTKEYFTLLSIVPSAQTPKARILKQQQAIMKEAFWIQDNIINK